MTIRSEFKRKNLRLPPGRYRGRNLYFVTLCFHDRRRLAVNPCLASWLIASLRKHAAVCAFFIHAYCVMPDHIHLLAAGGSDESNVIKFVEALKQDTAVEFARRTHRRLWQFKYYDSAGLRCARPRRLVYLDESGSRRPVPHANRLLISGIVHAGGHKTSQKRIRHAVVASME
jgi:REP element-mobilizing transposase RayT